MPETIYRWWRRAIAGYDLWGNGNRKRGVCTVDPQCSERRDKPFIAQNCAALPDTLLESILFGTSKGAFTGAMENKGLFELADGGTLFLDEINSMPLFLQSKLLRVLQDGSFRSLGGSETKRTNVKIIAATNVEPLEAIEKGQLRRDIYYRLSMMSIRIPPLRERKADIGHFVKFYVNKHNGTFHKQVQYVSKDLLKKLEEYDWPGNVRELEHVIVYGMSMVDETSALLQYKDIKGKLLLEKQADRKKTPESLEEVPKLCSSLREAVAAYEEKLIWQALEAAHGNISEAARILDVPRQTLQRKASQLRGEKAKENRKKETERWRIGTEMRTSGKQNQQNAARKGWERSDQNNRGNAEMEKYIGKYSVKDFLYLILGAFIYSIGTHSFIETANIAPGGAVGVALMLNHVTNLPVGRLTLWSMCRF